VAWQIVTPVYKNQTHEPCY